MSVAGAMNPQIRFGEDLMSRVSHVMSKPESVAEMADALKECINALIDETCNEAGADPGDIIEASGGMYLAGILRKDGVIDGDLAATSDRIKAGGATFCYCIRGGEREIPGADRLEILAES